MPLLKSGQYTIEKEDGIGRTYMWRYDLTTGKYPFGPGSIFVCFHESSLITNWISPTTTTFTEINLLPFGVPKAALSAVIRIIVLNNNGGQQEQLRLRPADSVNDGMQYVKGVAIKGGNSNSVVVNAPVHLHEGKFHARLTGNISPSLFIAYLDGHYI